MNKNKLLLKKYFENHSLVDADINSYNHFIAKRIQEIIEDSGEIVPAIIPEDVSEFKIKLDKVYVNKPEIIEADGSKRDIYPNEARLRKITYSAPLYVDVSIHIDGVQRETFNALIGKIPVMLKSKYCHLDGLKKEELIEKGEDPTDPGGYFILNGNERVLINVEDLASNRILVEKPSIGLSKYVAKLFSERGSVRIPHLLEQLKDGILYLSFTSFSRVPIVPVIKALGLVKDKEIMEFISDKDYDDVLVSLYDSIELKTEEDALEYVAKKIGINQPKEVKLEKVQERLDRYLLPHIGVEKEDRIEKAYILCKLIKKLLMVSKDGLRTDDKDHYINKRIKLSGDLLADLFRINLRVLINDMLYTFQRLVKRGKFQTTKIIIRDKLLTSRIKSAMATGSWPGNRKGISQNIDRTNFLATQSHLQRVVSLLSSTQENFDARALHGTHWGRLCAIETPEGTPIGLRKNMALLSEIAFDESDIEELKKNLESNGLEKV
ncbi:DNA-directed RNA polymerase subunit B'' [archaeon]|nr:DNA-directed RNA polymerase subunit B'' [archaeon]|tara:strand:- start:3103 stop:4584 length:1482 start_codon:yes stop_codon:yes gene_type:complete